MSDRIRVRGARQHNLKGVDVEIDRGRLTVLTGPSGSGKSSLAFDTIYAEGQRRYIESLSTYAKQFLERMPKPAVDLVEGVSPSVSIDQRNTIQSSRSTVGTVTEVYDYLRLLWSRVGTTVCPDCGEAVTPDTVQSATDRVLQESAGRRLLVTFPLTLSREITHAMAVSNLRSQGYVRVLADLEEIYLPDLPEDAETAAPSDDQDLTAAVELLVVVDRVVADDAGRERLADSLAAAFAEGHGSAVVLEHASAGPPTRRYVFDESFRCPTCDRVFPDPFPNLFSFNSPAGACDTCTGFGAVLEYAMELMVPDPSRSLADGALDPWTKPRYTRERAAVLTFAAEAGIDPHRPWADLPEATREVLIDGGRVDGVRFRGLVPFMKSREKKRYKAYIRVFLRQYQLPRVCGDCGGTRLKQDALNVRVGGRHIADVAALEVLRLRKWLAGDLGLTPFLEKVAHTVLSEISDRVGFLDDVGLGYLTLDRQARTLSGGEMQRIRLASCLGSRLVDTLYVLDEPTIGLHPHDTDRFIAVVDRLATAGNTVLVVEHDATVIEHADDIIELGPGAGETGGEIVFQGDWQALLQANTSTGRALAEDEPPSTRRVRGGDRRPGDQGWIELRGARLHNVDGVDARFPLGALTVVTGVSGSGKSSLVRGVLFHAVERALEGESSARTHLGEAEGSLEALEGAGALAGVSLVDQQPIGRTPRSNPATYIGAFKEVRAVFADLPESRARGYTPGYFSFNRAGGRCERCKGAGSEVVEMVFLADVAVPCEECGGARYRSEVLEVEYRGHTINDVLDMTVDQAIRFFIRQDRLGEALWNLQRVGLGYLRLGQPATTLSGGEAQRLKVARELARKKRKSTGRRKGGRRLYLLDEPTVGLGVGEVRTLVAVLRQLVDDGHAVVVVEHNLDVIAAADWVIDMGPGAAAAGGRVVIQAPPSDIAACPESRTGEHLARRARRDGRSARARA